MKVLLLAGAGTSVELGVPAMAGMAAEFLAHSEQWSIEPDLVRTLLGSVLDVERLIEQLDQVCSAREPLEAIGSPDPSLERVATVRSEVEWFVQHAAERINPRDAHQMWGGLLRAASSHNLQIVTTNYDRAIELAANAERVRLVDGFNLFGTGEVAEWQGFPSEDGAPWLVKLHGSTDWYEDRASHNPKKLRHPMPLFARGTLRLSGGGELGSSLVLPSREKLLTRPPYYRMTQTFLNAGDHCDIAFFVGTSLRDHHIRDVAVDVARRRPLFIVNPAGDAMGIEGAYAIAQPASLFLVSTLPSALRSDEPVAMLSSFVAQSVGENGEGIIDHLRVAIDASTHTNRRCEAIEALDRLAVCLDSKTVGQLLRDSDRTVSRYALGLVPQSVDRDELFRAASSSPHAMDPAFADELRLLGMVIGAHA